MRGVPSAVTNARRTGMAAWSSSRAWSVPSSRKSPGGSGTGVSLAVVAMSAPPPVAFLKGTYDGDASTVSFLRELIQVVFRHAAHSVRRHGLLHRPDPA